MRYFQRRELEYLMDDARIEHWCGRIAFAYYEMEEVIIKYEQFTGNNAWAENATDPVSNDRKKGRT